MTIAYVTVLESKRVVYKVKVDDLEDAYTEYVDGNIVDEDWLEDRVDNVEYHMEPPEFGHLYTFDLSDIPEVMSPDEIPLFKNTFD